MKAVCRKSLTGSATFCVLFTGMLYSDDLLDFSDIILYNRINLKYMKNKGEE